MSCVTDLTDLPPIPVINAPVGSWSNLTEYLAHLFVQYGSQFGTVIVRPAEGERYHLHDIPSTLRARPREQNISRLSGRLRQELVWQMLFRRDRFQANAAVSRSPPRVRILDFECPVYVEHLRRSGGECTAGEVWNFVERPAADSRTFVGVNEALVKEEVDFVFAEWTWVARNEDDEDESRMRTEYQRRGDPPCSIDPLHQPAACCVTSTVSGDGSPETLELVAPGTQFYAAVADGRVFKCVVLSLKNTKTKSLNGKSGPRVQRTLSESTLNGSTVNGRVRSSLDSATAWSEARVRYTSLSGSESFEDVLTRKELTMFLINGATESSAAYARDRILCGTCCRATAWLKTVNWWTNSVSDRLPDVSGEQADSSGEQADSSVCCTLCFRAYHLDCLRGELSQGKSPDVSRDFFCRDFFCTSCLSLSREQVAEKVGKYGHGESPAVPITSVLKSLRRERYRSPLADDRSVAWTECEFWNRVNHVETRGVGSRARSAGNESTRGHEFHDFSVQYFSDLDLPVEKSAERGSSFNQNLGAPVCSSSNCMSALAARCESSALHPWLRETQSEHSLGPIGGITKSWMYLGNRLTSFSWHTEDHWMFALNYLHGGSEKVWYSVPVAHEEKFSSLFNSSVDELGGCGSGHVSSGSDYVSSWSVYSNSGTCSLRKESRAGSQLMFDMTTMIDPRWTSSVLGIPIHRGVQRPGDLVVNFPGAYHAGLNCGVNLAESVNIAPRSWVPYGLQCESVYRYFSRVSALPLEEVLFHLFVSNTKRAGFLGEKKHLQGDDGNTNALEDYFRALWQEINESRTLLGPESCQEKQKSRASVLSVSESKNCMFCSKALFVAFVKLQESCLSAIQRGTTDILCLTCFLRDPWGAGKQIGVGRATTRCSAPVLILDSAALDSIERRLKELSVVDLLVAEESSRTENLYAPTTDPSVSRIMHGSNLMRGDSFSSDFVTGKLSSGRTKRCRTVDLHPTPSTASTDCGED